MNKQMYLYNAEATVTKAVWVDEKTELECKALRHPELKHWCGYVGIRADHRLYGVDYNDRELTGVSVHGGITYSDTDDGKVWWFGFDCAHVGDFVPGSAGWFAPKNDYTTYWTLEDVQDETARLAEAIDKLGAK